MAKIYSPPENIPAPQFSSDLETYRQNEAAFLQALRDFCEKNSNCPDKGKEISFPVGDGKARYMVLDYRRLIHLPLCDAYQIPEAHARGLLKADIIRGIKSVEAIRELFRKKDN